MFYRYDQNNSFGKFVVSAYVDQDVIVEAENAEAANTRAEQVTQSGIYFSGAGDCPCCGPRWSEAYEGDYSSANSLTEALDMCLPLYSKVHTVHVYLASGEHQVWTLGASGIWELDTTPKA